MRRDTPSNTTTGTRRGKNNNNDNNDNTTTTTAREGLGKNTSQDPFLWSVCGVDTTSLLCGESMLSKVTTLFRVGSTAGGNADSATCGGTDGTDGGGADDQERSAPEQQQIAESEHSREEPDAGSVDIIAASIGTDETKIPNHSKSDMAVTGMPTSSMNTKISVEETPDSPAASSWKSTGDQENDHASSSLGDGDDEDDVDVDDLLNNLEIPDFSISIDMDDDLSPEDQFDEPKKTTSMEKKKPWDGVDWKQRMAREEIFSKRYRPKVGEAQELQAMAEMLGVSKSTDLFKRVSASIGMSSNKMTEDIQMLFFGQHSILLAILPVRWKGKNCELLLLTDGFVLKYHRNYKSYNLLEKRYETCRLWDSVDFCERSSPYAVTIQIDDDASTRYEFETAVDDGGDGDGDGDGTSPTLDTILKSLERVMILHDLHDSSNNNSDRTNLLGWQYLRVRNPAYTAAVVNDPAILSDKRHEVAISRSINEVDAYNRYAPLHYAVLQEHCNPEVIKALLKAGADPNLLDGDERSAMYHAERNELPEKVMEILRSGGGERSKLAEIELRGELFSGVEVANYNSEERRKRDRTIKENDQAIKDQKVAEAQVKVEGAQNEMGKAMSALILRGEKIAQMDQKTKDLEAESKTFADLAARLKDEVKNKKWYQL